LPRELPSHRDALDEQTALHDEVVLGVLHEYDELRGEQHHETAEAARDGTE
jgi:hypothetical protein